MIGYDIDGVLTAGVIPASDSVVISGRTFAEYDQTCVALAASMPVYIRGSGAFGDAEDAGRFKAMMIRHLGVTLFHEDDQVQAAIIKREVPTCEVVMIAA